VLRALQYLVSHVNSHHPNAPVGQLDFKCDICGEAIINPIKLALHKARYHRPGSQNAPSTLPPNKKRNTKPRVPKDILAKITADADGGVGAGNREAGFALAGEPMDVTDVDAEVVDEPRSGATTGRGQKSAADATGVVDAGSEAGQPVSPATGGAKPVRFNSAL
jgi:hypothetical protein